MFNFSKDKRIIYHILDVLDCDCISDYMKLRYIECLLNSYVRVGRCD